MFKDCKKSFLIATFYCIAMFVIQGIAIIATVNYFEYFNSYLGNLGLIFKRNALNGIQALLWIFLTVIWLVIVVYGITGFIFGLLKKFEGFYKKTRIAFNIVLIVPVVILAVLLVIDLLQIKIALDNVTPDVFGNVRYMTIPGFYICLVLSIYLPIVGNISKEGVAVKENGVKVKPGRLSNSRFLALVAPMVAIICVACILSSTLTSSFEAQMDSMFGRGARHVETAEGTENWDTNYYGETPTLEDAKAHGLEILRESTGEGMILLKNNGVLPLAKNSEVSPFGKGYKFPFFDACNGGASMKYSFTYGVFPETALERNFTLVKHAANLQPNVADSNKGATNDGSNYDQYPDQPLSASGTLDCTRNSFGGNNRIPELAVSKYNQLTQNQLDEMADTTALVFISRSGSEGADKKFDGYNDGTPHYLALSKNEKDMIKKAKEICNKVVLVVNSVNAIELGPVMNGEYECDAILITMNPGENGFESMSDILCGEINPSGRTVDTYSRNFLLGPEMKNYGTFRYTDANYNNSARTYMAYEEDIYVGYKFYETAHDIGATNYEYGELDEEGGVITEGRVCYPFGYGLSYTDFTEKIVSYDDSGSMINVGIEIKNTGDVAGKDVVELYYKAPYTELDEEYDIEKATANLIEYDKTKLLEPGEKETLHLSFLKEEMASYCFTRDNGDDTFGCWMMEEGNYEISLRKNSHQITETRTFHQPSTVWYDASNPRQMEKDKQSILNDDGRVTNVPEKGEDANWIAATNAIQKCSDFMMEEQTRLTRKNWDETVPVDTRTNSQQVPTKPFDQEKWGSLWLDKSFNIATDEILGDIEGSKIYVAPEDMPLSGEDNGLTVLDLRGRDYYDEAYDQLLDQIDFEGDKAKIIEYLTHSNYYTPAIQSIGLPMIYHCEGANGVRVATTEEGNKMTTTWCMSPLIAASYNKELAYKVGEALAQEALAAGITTRYSPAFNIHRSPFSGRNMEYFSEDPILSGRTVLNIINATSTGGMIDYIKHFALNDQETNRGGTACVCIWATEQAARETYFRPFELVIREARKTINYISDNAGTIATKTMRGVCGMMLSQSNLGTMKIYDNYDLITGLLRNEYNFQGVMNTDWDSASNAAGYEMTILAGNDSWLTGNSQGNGVNLPGYDTATARMAYRNAIHHIAYQVANSNVLQGAAPGTVIFYDESPWKAVVTTANAIGYSIVGAGALWIGLRVLLVRRRKPNEA